MEIESPQGKNPSPRELPSLLRAEGAGESQHSAGDLTKGAMKSRRQPGRLEKIFVRCRQDAAFLQRKVTELMITEEIPAETGAGGAVGTSSFSIPSDLFALSSKLRFLVLFQ